MNVGELMNKIQNTSNKLIKENDLGVKTTELSNELLETIKIIENCTSCKDNKDKKIDRIDLDKIENCLVELEKEKQRWKKENIIYRLGNELFKEILCESCKGKEIKKLIDKCGNEEIARFLYYQCKPNVNSYDDYIRWIPFDEFKNIE